MEKIELTKEEEQFLKQFVLNVEQGEKNQVNELFMYCDSPHQFAKTHSTFINDWEKAKQEMENNLKKGLLPPNTSANLYQETINALDRIIQKKLELVRMLFENKFNESIYNYLGPDGKTKKFLGLF